MGNIEIRWTDYMKYRLGLRRFDIAVVEKILRYSSERYIDTSTGRLIAMGRHNRQLVMIPYEKEGNKLTPLTIHVTSRQQITFRIKSGRFGIE